MAGDGQSSAPLLAAVTARAALSLTTPGAPAARGVLGTQGVTMAVTGIFHSEHATHHKVMLVSHQGLQQLWFAALLCPSACKETDESQAGLFWYF